MEVVLDVYFLVIIDNSSDPPVHHWLTGGHLLANSLPAVNQQVDEKVNYLKVLIFSKHRLYTIFIEQKSSCKYKVVNFSISLLTRH